MPADTDIVAEIMCRYACYGFKINVWELEKKEKKRTMNIRWYSEGNPEGGTSG